MTWRIFERLSVDVAGLAARKAVNKVWRLATGDEPPTKPAPHASWPAAVGWAMVSGAAVGLARMLAAHRTAEYHRRSTGQLTDDQLADG
jgi:hypothetical protein